MKEEYLNCPILSKLLICKWQRVWIKPLRMAKCTLLPISRTLMQSACRTYQTSCRRPPQRPRIWKCGTHMSMTASIVLKSLRTRKKKRCRQRIISNTLSTEVGVVKKDNARLLVTSKSLFLIASIQMIAAWSSSKRAMGCQSPWTMLKGPTRVTSIAEGSIVGSRSWRPS